MVSKLQGISIEMNNEVQLWGSQPHTYVALYLTLSRVLHCALYIEISSQLCPYIHLFCTIAKFNIEGLEMRL